MTLQDLETQILNLSPTDRLRIVQSVIESLIPAVGELTDSLELNHDRTPHHPLRSLPLTIPPDFDQPILN